MVVAIELAGSTGGILHLYLLNAKKFKQVILGKEIENTVN